MGTIRSFYRDSSGLGAINVSVQRVTDGYFLDVADGVFRAVPATPMTALTAQAGVWTGSFLGTITYPSITDQDYIVHYHDPAGSPANAILDSQPTTVQGGTNASGGAGVGAVEADGTSGTVATAISVSSFVASIPAGSTDPAWYVGRTATITSGPTRWDRAVIVAASSLTSSGGVVAVTLTFDGSPSRSPHFTAAHQAGESFTIAQEA